MKNKKTTWAGIATVVSAALTVIAAALSGGDIMSAIQTALLPAIAGLGLLASADGSL